MDTQEKEEEKEDAGNRASDSESDYVDDDTSMSKEEALEIEKVKVGYSSTPFYFINR